MCVPVGPPGTGLEKIVSYNMGTGKSNLGRLPEK